MQTRKHDLIALKITESWSMVLQRDSHLPSCQCAIGKCLGQQIS